MRGKSTLLAVVGDAMKLAIVFPGQGSQKVGMMARLRRVSRRTRHLRAGLRRLLGEDLVGD